MILELIQEQNHPITTRGNKRIVELKKNLTELVRVIRAAENGLIDDLSAEDMLFLAEQIDADPLQVSNELSFIADKLESYLK